LTREYAVSTVFLMVTNKDTAPVAIIDPVYVESECRTCSGTGSVEHADDFDGDGSRVCRLCDGDGYAELCPCGDARVPLEFIPDADGCRECLRCTEDREAYEAREAARLLDGGGAHPDDEALPAEAFTCACGSDKPADTQECGDCEGDRIRRALDAAAAEGRRRGLVEAAEVEEVTTETDVSDLVTRKAAA
jgi:hypothetical protein